MTASYYKLWKPTIYKKPGLMDTAGAGKAAVLLVLIFNVFIAKPIIAQEFFGTIHEVLCGK